MDTERTIQTEAQLQAYAGELIDHLKPLAGTGQKAVVLALHGDLGAGKTTFVQQAGAVLGVHEPITSPTFLIMKQYATEDPVFSTLTHIDAYRVEGPAEIEVLGFSELLASTGRLICIEWAERIGALLPPDTIHLTFTIGEDDERTVSLTGIDKIDR